MWKVNSHVDFEETYQEFETREDAAIEMERMAEELAECTGAHLTEFPPGLITVWGTDEDGEGDNYICFWISEQ